jgi:hypothetical protein
MPNRPLLNWWKAAAQAKREQLQRVLTLTLPPGLAYRRSVLVGQALNSVNRQKDWVDAIDQHLSDVRQVLEGAGAFSASGTKAKTKTGSLGD